jgi:hypothetical protein
VTGIEGWMVAAGIGGIILGKVMIIAHLVRRSGPDRTGALILAAVLGLGLASVIVGVVLWLILSPRV